MVGATGDRVGIPANGGVRSDRIVYSRLENSVSKNIEVALNGVNLWRDRLVYFRSVSRYN